jgi:hypothetical protein
VPNEHAIASWLEENEHDYFVELKRQTLPTKEEPPDKFGPEDLILTSHSAGVKLPAKIKYFVLQQKLHDYAAYDFNYPRISQSFDNSKQSVSGFAVTAKSPFVAVEFQFVPQYGNLPWWTGYIVFVFSKVAVRLFHSFMKLKERSWSERVPPADVKWKTQEVEWKHSDIATAVASIPREWESAIRQALVAKFALPEVKQQDQNEAATTATKETRAEVKRKPTKADPN